MRVFRCGSKREAEATVIRLDPLVALGAPFETECPGPLPALHARSPLPGRTRWIGFVLHVRSRSRVRHRCPTAVRSPELATVADARQSSTVHDGSNHSVEVIEGWPRVRRWLFAEQLGVLPQSSVGRCRAVPPLMSRVSITIMMKDKRLVPPCFPPPHNEPVPGSRWS